MNSGEETIFNAVKEALSGLSEKTPLPDYDETTCISENRLEGETLWEIFSANFSAVNGRVMPDLAALIFFLNKAAYRQGYCDPALRSAVGLPLEKSGFVVEYVYDRTRYDDYAFGITRASGVIAESGTIILNDFETSDRLAALSPWVHVAVLDGEHLIYRSIPDAIYALGDCPNIIWATGPSKTADVEGILIEGVHGPGEEICLRLFA